MKSQLLLEGIEEMSETKITSTEEETGRWIFMDR